MEDAGKREKPVFRDLSADDTEPETTEIESLCVNCMENGMTRILLTKIPHHKEIVLMSFECEHCGYKNNETQPGGRIQEKGIRITLHVKVQEDLNRQVVKSDYACVRIPQLDFEIPALSQKGEVTTVEGILSRSLDRLELDQVARRAEDPETAKLIDSFLAKLHKLRKVETPFTLVLEDISGNSFIENPYAPRRDSGVETVLFKRSSEQNHTLGLYSSDELGQTGDAQMKPPEDVTLEDLQGEVLQFPTNCPECNAPCETNMKLTKIPYFKDTLIMATNCETCGHRTNEVKSGGGIEPKGVRIEVKVAGCEDFNRDVLKSETCSLLVPELELEVGSSLIGGRFTTVEGLLQTVKEQLTEKSATWGDSSQSGTRVRFTEFLDKVDEVLTGKKKVTVVLDDPAGNSYVQSLTAPNPDPGLVISHYERTFEQNEELGLNDMKTENYEES